MPLLGGTFAREEREVGQGNGNCGTRIEIWRSGEGPVQVWKFGKTEELSSIYVDGYQLQL